MTNENKHTPGPWEAADIDERDDYSTRVWSADEREVCSLTSDDEHLARGDVRGFTVAERDANARLIAAAPDLLAALEMVTRTADTGHETGHTEAEVIAGNWDVIGPVVRAALAKARGSA